MTYIVAQQSYLELSSCPTQVEHMVCPQGTMTVSTLLVKHISHFKEAFIFVTMRLLSSLSFLHTR